MPKPQLDCFVCEQSVTTGERRDSVRRGASSYVRHTPDNDPPEPADTLFTSAGWFEMSMDGGETWMLASVEGVNHCKHQYRVAAVDNSVYLEDRPYQPWEYTDQFHIVSYHTDDGWSDLRVLEEEQDWEEQEDGSVEWDDPEYHDRGTARFRPTDYTQAGYDWGTWRERGTDPKELWVRYWVHDLSVPDLADEYDVSGWTIRNWMDKVGIERRTREEAAALADTPSVPDHPDEFRREREAAEIAQKRVAEEAGISQPKVSQWELQRKSLPDDDVRDLRQALESELQGES